MISSESLKPVKETGKARRRIVAADLFCGGGGTSEGLYAACREIGCSLELTAINHWDTAIATHTLNHPEARNLCESVDEASPRKLFREGELDILWASPECTHHSVARGGRPVNDQSRATAWCVVRWADALRPPVILVENVPEFRMWGGISAAGKPLKRKKGATFVAWCQALESLGYRVDSRILCAADFGDPTTRRRLFVQAIRGRRKIVWPDATHAPAEEVGEDLWGARLKPWTPARDIIDWSLPSESIFSRKRPLKENTIRRIEAGLWKYGLPWLAAYLVKLRGTGDDQISRAGASLDQPTPTITAGGGHLGLCEPYLIPQLSGGAPRPVSKPVPTITTTSRGIGLVQPYLVQTNHAGGARVRSIERPLHTVAGNRGETALCEPYLIRYNGTAGAEDIGKPISTVDCRDRLGLVQPELSIDGEWYLLDIRFRMLQPHELAAAQGFPRGYAFAGTRTEQVKQIGNAVPCGLARAIVLAVMNQTKAVEA